MSKLIYNEWYGHLSREQLAAYKKYNVSPSDHSELCERYGTDNRDAIVAAVAKYSQRTGMFNAYEMWAEGRIA